MFSLIMNNKIFLFYRPVLSFSRFLLRNAVNNQVAQNIPQRLFSERILSDMRNIDSIWRRSKENTKFREYVYLSCNENVDLLSYAIDMIKCVSSRDTGSTNANLVLELIKTFNDYFKLNKLQFSPTLDQSIDVLSTVLEFKNFKLLQLACDAFKLCDKPLVYKPFIESLILERKYTEAAYLTSALQLQKEFDEKEILLPLLLQGSMEPVALYITNYPDLQIKTAKYLDECLSTKDIASVEKHRKVRRTLSSIISLFKIPLDNCPNLQFFRSKGAINKLVQRRSPQSVLQTPWIEMLKDVVKDNEDLKRYLIHKLLVRKDKKAALHMANVLNIDVQECLPEPGSEILDESNQPENLEVVDNEEKFEVYDISDEYLKISLKPEDIKVIDTKESFIACIDDMCENYNMIGIDSEWKPNFGLSRDKLSLIQLAAHDKVYIIDVFRLSEKLESKYWDKFLDDIFGNPNIVKLGCGIVSDVHMILESIKGTEGKAVKFSHILDMVLFYQKLHEVYPLEMKYGGDKAIGNVKGLSSMCEVILGKPLNKENRLCDWEVRPLNERQLQYAALDAHCLLQMYDKLREESIEKKMNFDHIAKVAIVLTTSQWRPKKRYKGIKTGKGFQVHTSVPVENLKIVIDSSFENQGKELRKFGADVIILQGDDAAEKAVELSEKEGRIVVCSEVLYDQIKERVKEGTCYYFSSPEENQIKVTNFLQHFNAQVSTKGILSRCVNCNSNDGIKLSSGDIGILHSLGNIDGSINSKLNDNINSFSNELKVVLNDILNSKVDIKISSTNNSSLSSEFAFLCKTCGHVS